MKMRSNLQHRWLACLAILLASFGMTTGAGAQNAPAGTFSLPRAGQDAVWEAEQAARLGEWKSVPTARASGGAVAVPAAGGSSLQFTVEVPQTANVQIYPVLGPHGDRRPARRFPYPLERRPGPDSVDWWQEGGRTLVFFTAPEAGRVVAVDPDKGAFVRSATVGGYLSDLVMDRKANLLYVADATGDRVLSLNPADLSVVRETRAAGTPWSLALGDGMLYVGCQRGKEVLAISTASGGVVARAALPYEVAHVEVTGGAKPTVVAWPMPVVYDMETWAPIPADAEQYGVSRRTWAEAGTRNKPGFKRINREGTHTLKLEVLTDKGWTRTDVDTKSVTDGPQSSPPPAWMDRPLAGPDAMVVVGERLFFTAPATGRVCPLDLKDGKLGTPIEVGGCPVDLTPDVTGSRLFVCDAAGNRVVVVDVKTGKVTGEAAVPSGPNFAWYFAAPGWVQGTQQMLFVSCAGAKQVAAIDPTSLKSVWLTNLPAEPALLSVQSPPNTGWWPLLPLERIALANTTRLAVHLAPRALATGSLESLGQAGVSPRFGRHTSVTLERPGGKTVITADNHHLLQVAQQPSGSPAPAPELLDTGDYTDLQRPAADAPLTAMDQPGAVTVSVDGGPALSWRRGTWMTPTQGQLLKVDTPAFRRWNGLVFSLEPGKHVFTVTAQSPLAQLDALAVSRPLQGWVDLRIAGRPPQSEALPERYRSLFYDKEPVQVDVTVANRTKESRTVHLAYELRNYMDEAVDRGEKDVPVPAGGETPVLLPFAPKETGTFRLIVVASSGDGQLSEEYRFTRLPKLEHPRFLFRKEDLDGIRARVAAQPRLFGNYFAWVRRECDRKGFLPVSLVSSVFAGELPGDQQKLANKGNWRRYDLGWRILAVQFGAMFDQDAARRDYFRGRIRGLLKEPKSDNYCTFHYHGPFFPGLEAIVYDLVAATPGEADDLLPAWRAFFAKSVGSMDVFPWTLAAIEEPISPKERQILCHVGEWLANVERYMDAHMGERGGTRWLNERTWCYCPYAGYGYSFLYLSNILDMPRFHEKKIVYSFLTHHVLSMPANDQRRMLGPVGPRGEPLRWLDSVLCKHPLLKNLYGWEGLVKNLDRANLPADEVDRLLKFREEAAPTTPMAFAVPLGLALGWYDPKAPAVGLNDLPPTTVFDVEGQVVMRSGFDKSATELFFTCGVRDHVYRHQPTDVRLIRGGHFLLGTASSCGDDGNSDPGKTWGNIVVIEPSDWLRRWGENKRHPRAEEYAIFNRFTDETFRYLARDRRVSGYAPAENGFGGGLDLHGHTESVFLQDGQLTGYETRPDWDYAAGDATNSWPLGLADGVSRQVVYLKPNTVVVYDRLALGPKAERTFWLAATGPELTVGPGAFTVRAGDQALRGDVLLPAKAALQAFDPTSPGSKYNTPPPFSVTQPWFLFDGATRHQKVLEIHPLSGGRSPEYLVVLQSGPAANGRLPEWSKVESKMDGDHASVTLRLNGKDVTLRFRRKGEVGGDIAFGAGRPTAFAERVDDTYRHWEKDRRFKRWMSDPAFSFIVPRGDTADGMDGRG